VGEVGKRSVECDDSIADLDDPCEKKSHYSCSADAKRILRCDGARFVQDDKCKSSQRCAIRAGNVGCW
jgi:hypothetical protein